MSEITIFEYFQSKIQANYYFSIESRPCSGMNLMNHHTNRRKAESPKQILQHPHAAAMAAALPNSFLPTQPLPPAAAMSPLALQQLHQVSDEIFADTPFTYYL